MQTYTTHHISWKSNKGTMKLWQSVYTNLKQKPRGAVSTATLLPSISLLKVFEMQTTPQHRSTKMTSRLYWKSSSWSKSSMQHNRSQPPWHLLQSKQCPMMTDVFFCRNTGHIIHYCPDVQWYNCEELSHFAQDCPFIRTPHHHNRLHSQLHYDHNLWDRSQSHNYRHSPRWCFDQSQSCHWSYHGTSSSNYWRHASHSPSNQCSSSCYPLTSWCSRQHLD